MGGVVLVACKIGDLVLNADSRQPSPGPLAADGWQVGALHGAVASSAKVAQAWLDTRSTSLQYSPQPARVLAEVYDRSGHPEQARRLRYLAARRITAQAPSWAKPWRATDGALVGHGYYPLAAVAWVVLLLVIAGGLASTQLPRFTPTDPAQAQAAATKVATSRGGTAPAPLTGATPSAELGDYPCLNPWAYALQTVVPPAAAIQESAWQPVGWVFAAFTLLKAISWVLVVLLLAGITGLLRRT